MPVCCSTDPDEGVFTHVDVETRDIILEDVTHARVDRTGKGQVAAGGGKVTFVRGQDVKDVSMTDSPRGL